MTKASAYFRLENMDGNHDVKELKRELDTLHGVFSVSIDEESERLAVDYDTTGIERRQIQKMIENMGYDVVSTRLEKNVM